MRLFILRHADAETEGHRNDIDRKLTPEGIAEAECVAERRSHHETEFYCRAHEPDGASQSHGRNRCQAISHPFASKF